MRKFLGKGLWVLPTTGVLALGGLCILTFAQSQSMDASETVSLPTPGKDGKNSIEGAIGHRRSVRTYASKPLTLQQVTQLCWAAAGKSVDAISGATRTYPSAGGIYPGNLYVVAGKVEELSAGIYRYEGEGNRLVLVQEGDYRDKLSEAALGQSSIRKAPVTFVMTADIERTMERYGSRGRKLYVPMEAGCSAQNIHLQCVSLRLGTVIIGAFHDEKIGRLLNLDSEQPLWIMPTGKIAED